MKITERRARWIGRLGSWLVRALGATWRKRGPNHRVRDDAIYAIRHGDLLVPAICYRHHGIAILISRHGDGEAIAQVVTRLGFRCVRGSSSRGGARAVLEMLRECGDRPWAVTPDGPRGPRGSVAAGIVSLAAHSGRPILAAGFASSRAKRLSSWDRFAIPWPFARIAVHVSEPIAVPADVDETQTAAIRARIAAALDECDRHAELALHSKRS